MDGCIPPLPHMLSRLAWRQLSLLRYLERQKLSIHVNSENRIWEHHFLLLRVFFVIFLPTFLPTVSYQEQLLVMLGAKKDGIMTYEY
jgi:hypothetical protein